MKKPHKRICNPTPMPSKPKKIRADQLLVEQGLAPSRTKAQALIMAGGVFCGTRRIEKPSEMFSTDDVGTAVLPYIKKKDHPYVSRGGVKLKSAIDQFNISIKNKICLDVGASTGGFTDCLLQEGAKKVYALDVGYGQIDWSLRNDQQVVVLERINFRNYNLNDIVDPIDVVTIDVSFISLEKIIPQVVKLFNKKQNQILIALIKPQFEVGREVVGKGGIVRDTNKQMECVERITAFCVKQGFKIKGTLPSPLKGQDGNQEYLLIGQFEK